MTFSEGYVYGCYIWPHELVLGSILYPFSNPVSCIKKLYRSPKTSKFSSLFSTFCKNGGAAKKRMDFSHFSAVRWRANLKCMQCIWIWKYYKTGTGSVGTSYCIGCIPIYSECQRCQNNFGMFACFQHKGFVFGNLKCQTRYNFWGQWLKGSVCGFVNSSSRCVVTCVRAHVRWCEREEEGGEVNPNRQLNTVPVTPERRFSLRWRPGWQLGRAETEPGGGRPASPLVYPSIPPFSVARSDKVGANAEKETQTDTGLCFLSVAPAEASWKVCKWMMPPEICSVAKRVLKSFASLD